MMLFYIHGGFARSDHIPERRIRDHLKIWIGRCQDGTFQSKTSFQQAKKNSKNE